MTISAVAESRDEEPMHTSSHLDVDSAAEASTDSSRAILSMLRNQEQGEGKREGHAALCQQAMKRVGADRCSRGADVSQPLLNSVPAQHPITHNWISHHR